MKNIGRLGMSVYIVLLVAYTIPETECFRGNLSPEELQLEEELIHEQIDAPEEDLELIADSLLMNLSVMKDELDQISAHFSEVSSNNKRVDVKSALNFIRIIKGNGCYENQYQCLEAADEVPECISVHAVCDGIVDCRNGNDEHPDRCHLLTPMGSSWGGELQWSGCESHRASRVYLLITRSHQDKILRSIMHISATLVYVWSENGNSRSRTENLVGHFCYGNKSLKLNSSPSSHVAADLQCTFIDDLKCLGKLYRASTGTICSRIVLNRQ